MQGCHIFLRLVQKVSCIHIHLELKGFRDQGEDMMDLTTNNEKEQYFDRTLSEKSYQMLKNRSQCSKLRLMIALGPHLLINLAD